MENIQIIPKDKFKPSTITTVSSFNTNVNVNIIAEFLPVTHIFNSDNKKIKLISGSRHSIEYYGTDYIIVSVCYKKNRRGMRTGAMNNMVSLDIQVDGKNIHSKLSEISITNVGTSNIKFAEKVFGLIILHINMLNNNIKYCKNLGEKIINKNKEWVLKNCTDDNNNLISLSNMLSKINKLNSTEYDIRFIKILSIYLDDFEKDESIKYLEKINKFLTFPNIFKGFLTITKPSILNSVYHILLSKENKIRVPLHRLSFFLAKLNIRVEFHNWISEGVNICFPIMENKEGIHTLNKIYKHRFTIHEFGSIRQCSPTYTDESYLYYTNVVKLIQKFVESRKNI